MPTRAGVPTLAGDMLKHLARAAALCALTSFAVVATATPALAFRLTDMRLDITVHGSNADAWHYQDDAYPDPLRSWVQGNGTQTVTFADAHPVRYVATVLSGRVPVGPRLSPFGLTPAAAPPAFHAVVKRTTGAWQPHDPDGCDSEGHCDGQLVPVLHHTPSCPDQRVDLNAQLVVEPVNPGGHTHRLALRFQPAPAMAHLWSSCPPDIDGAQRPFIMGDPPTVLFAGAFKRLSHLRRGTSLRLKGHMRDGAINGVPIIGCQDLTGKGLQECATTDVVLDVHRAR